ncbi:TetR/AcrR family transcriptional regulator [Dyella sp.]|uniref:TetR/AcrR family transcriptional regulator n=1 Tax=Dyella sp. TaxID=1869338 RepID=UPI002ED4B636
MTTPKRAATRETILDHAYALARREGLEGLSIGALAQDVGMSKSGVFAHFGAREELQLALMQSVQKRFVDLVLRPALRQPRGISRLRAMIDHWHEWVREHQSGCVLLTAVGEYDGRSGPLRDAMQAQQVGWRNELRRAVEQARALGEVDSRAEADQFAFEIYAVMLGLHHDASLFGFEQASGRARAAIDRLLSSYRI